MTHLWKVVPVSEAQKLDVRSEDLIKGGLYRRCHTYRGGGGYDLFPQFAATHLGGKPDQYSWQFVVQLFGCNLDCPYCYVTREGVWGEFVQVETLDLVLDYVRTGLPVFHLMGGAPALQMKYWPELLAQLEQTWQSKYVFHSDFLLTESVYNLATLADIKKYENRSLYAIDIKGFDAEEWERNTRKPLDTKLFFDNWRKIQDIDLPAYITFTACDKEKESDFWDRAEQQGIDVGQWIESAYHIELIDYNALSHVDDVPWGG